MGLEKEVEKTITEKTDKVAEEVSNKIENIVEMVGIDAKAVEPIIAEVTSAVATVAASGLKEVTEKLGVKMISESSLTEDQKKLATNIYESVKSAIQGFISDPNINSTIKITKVIGQVIKQLETANVDGKKITGSDKKAVAIQLGRILIKEVTPDDKGEAEILIMYDLVAEQTLEAMIEVSKVVNVAVQEIETKCCPGLLTLFKKSK